MPEKSDLRQRMTISRYPYDQKGMKWIFEADENLKKLPDIDKTIKALARLPLEKRHIHDDFHQNGEFYGTGEPRFFIKKDSRLYQLRDIAKILLSLQSKNVSLSHHAHAFLESFSWCYFEISDTKKAFTEEEAKKKTGNLTTSIENLNHVLNSQSFMDRVKHAESMIRKHNKSLQKWITKAFKRAPQLLFIHLQVGLIPPHHKKFEWAFEARKNFLNARNKSPLFLYLVGYVFKVHYHPEKGIIQDILLFYDARKVREAVSLTGDLEKLWMNTTYDDQEGRSYGISWCDQKRLHLSFSSNEKPPMLPQDQCVLRRDDKDDKKTINRLTRYLSRYDTYISYHTASKTRTLGKSVIHNRKKRPSLRKRRRVHPRRYSTFPISRGASAVDGEGSRRMLRFGHRHPPLTQGVHSHG